jgi:GrpB-like predicted nucleotidyltransferase (UPF0157 family)
MKKQLTDMTNEELGKLFPIIMAEPDACWVRRYSEEESAIKSALGERNIIRVEHIGSTSVPNLKAKPTIDILLEVPEETDTEFIIEKLGTIGYLHTPKPENPAPHLMFMKGYTLEGFKGQAYHVHVRYSGDWDELYFRDYLREHSDIAREYSELKVRLSKEYRNDRDGYTDKKTDFIRSVTQIAKKEKSR